MLSSSQGHQVQWCRFSQGKPPPISSCTSKMASAGWTSQWSSWMWEQMICGYRRPRPSCPPHLRGYFEGKNPGARIFVATVLPRPRDWHINGIPCSVERIDDFNRHLELNRKRGKFGVIKTSHAFYIKGQIREHLYAKDGLHLSAEGKAVLSKIFETTIKYQSKHIAKYFRTTARWATTTINKTALLRATTSSKKIGYNLLVYCWWNNKNKNINLNDIYSWEYSGHTLLSYS